jgi:hypothetical protein
MACLTTSCWNTIGLGVKTAGLGGRENDKIGNQYGSTYSSSSQCFFTNGRFLPISLLTLPVNRGGCGAAFGPQIFNGVGTLTWKAIKQQWGSQVEKTIIPGKTWKQCGITRGIWTIYVTWTPNACAKSKRFITTKSYAYPCWIFP